MKIVVPKSLMDEMGGQTEISLEKLTDQQKQVLLSNREAFKEMDTKEIAMNQLTEIQQVSRGIDVIASYARVRAADYLSDKAKSLGDPMLQELKLNVDKFSTQLSREAKSKEISNNTVQEVRNYTSAQINNPNQVGGNVMPNTNNNQTQPNNSNVEGRIVHVFQYTAQAVMDPLSREMQKNPDVASSIVSSVMPPENGYLSVKIPSSN
jgi:hypothetical protein